MKLKGRVALIAGASRNVGRATALAFAREGADLILNARTSGDDLEEVAEECRALGVKALPVLADVADYNQVNDMVAQALAEFEVIDILFNSVAIRPKGTIQELSYEEFHRVIALDVHAAFYLCKAIVPGMEERRRGSIIMIGGLASYLAANRSSTAHIAGKHGLAGFVKSLAREVGPYNVRANLINVSLLDTERRHPEWYPHADGIPQTLPEHLLESPLRRAGKPEEVAEVAVFLASDSSSYVTGGAILCSGGRGV
jgi:NAD(P)-dependent dehydrogenase (short-subunit alcohol dehydrogenase family)